jgi:hypothetical protein
VYGRFSLSSDHDPFLSITPFAPVRSRFGPFPLQEAETLGNAVIVTSPWPSVKEDCGRVMVRGFCQGGNSGKEEGYPLTACEGRKKAPHEGMDDLQSARSGQSDQGDELAFRGIRLG